MFIRCLILVFLFLFFGLCILGNMNTEYGTLLIHPLIFGRHVFGCRGSCLPPPRSRVPRQESHSSWSIIRFIIYYLHTHCYLSYSIHLLHSVINYLHVHRV
jgi:hypothetical protein